MTRALAAAFVGMMVAIVACDGGSPKKLPPQVCKADDECKLTNSDPCIEGCSGCMAVLKTTPPLECTGTVRRIQCTVSPCENIEAACIEGLCQTRRRGGTEIKQISKECLENPLAKGCS